MNKENTKKLLDDFPEFWKHRENIMASLIGFGFECGDGWFDLIYQLCVDLKRDYYDNLSEENQERFYVTQVKEKYGGLRFYTSFGGEDIWALIDKAENDSLEICELCGIGGTLHTTSPQGRFGWVRTLCPACAVRDSDRKYYPYKSDANE